MSEQQTTRVFVVGGSGGIGSSIVGACAQRGAWPIVGYCHSAEAAEQLVRSLDKGRACLVDLTIGSFEEADLPEAEVLVHCAGRITSRRQLITSRPEEINELMVINALGPLRLTQAMLRRSDPLRQIIFVLSSAIACRGAGPYALSKMAGLAVAKLLSVELAERNIVVDVVVPGWTETPMAETAARATGRTLADVRAEHPANRILTPGEIADLTAGLIFDRPAGLASQFIVWDLRASREPQRCNLQDAFDLPRGKMPGGM
jgi:NAD(P)-dependent dehydrogenase (short-subunit alcohol dehydrogenase family)